MLNLASTETRFQGALYDSSFTWRAGTKTSRPSKCISSAASNRMSRHDARLERRLRLAGDGPGIAVPSHGQNRVG
jgi:hypothetical protein